jgi:LysR family transcriptional regulator, nitrogen assimilation regulatory protein
VPDFKRLGYFVQIAELGSLTRAAERLRIAQPSLSRQMRLLEQELGVELFTRGPRGMQLTHAGEALRVQISGPLRHIGHALYEIRSLPSDAVGSVIFGMPPSVACVLGDPVIKCVREECGGVSLQIVEAQSGHLLEWMKRGDLDAAVLYGPTPGGLNATRLLDDDLLLVGPPGSEFTSAATIALKQLAHIPLILPSDMHGLRIAIESAAARSRVRLQLELSIDSLSLTKRIVAQGMAHTILPQTAFLDEVAVGSLSAVPIENPRLQRQLFITMQSSAEAPRAILQVATIVRKVSVALVSSGAWPRAHLFGVGDS